MKKIFLYLCLFLASMNVFAQNTNKHDVTLGIKAGLNHSTFIYTDKNLKSLPNNIFIRPDIGLFAEVFINDNTSLAPEVFLYSKGNLTKYQYEGYYNVTYTVKTKYIATRVPVYYYYQTFTKSGHNIRPFNKNLNTTRLFVVFAPGINYLLGGNISLTQPGLPIDEVNINVGKANMNNVDFSIFIGAGGSFTNSSLTSKVELGYNIGLINSFSQMEINESSNSTNIHAYNITGKRFNHNIELNISIGIPMKVGKSVNDACESSNRYIFYSGKKHNKSNNNNVQKSKNKKYMNIVY